MAEDTPTTDEVVVMGACTKRRVPAPATVGGGAMACRAGDTQRQRLRAGTAHGRKLDGAPPGCVASTRGHARQDASTASPRSHLSGVEHEREAILHDKSNGVLNKDR